MSQLARLEVHDSTAKGGQMAAHGRVPLVLPSCYRVRRALVLAKVVLENQVKDNGGPRGRSCLQ